MAPPKRKSPVKKVSASKAKQPDGPAIVIDAGDKTLSPKQLDMVRAASGWSLSELFDQKTREPTGKFMAARIWLLIREHRPDVTPEEIYEKDLAELGDYGVDIVRDESPVDPTNAAG